MKKNAVHFERGSFQSWFDGSKAVDAQGRPLVVYHGTAADIKAFDAQMVGSKHVDLEVGEAYFFTTCTKTASWYAADSGKQKNGGANVMPVYLNLQNPLIVDFQEEGIEYLAEDIERAKANGYDGLIAINYNDGTVSDHYIAFSPSQIKSAIGATVFLNESNLLVDQSPMETIMKKSLQEKQLVANQAFENYEFGDGLEIVGTDGWDTTDPQDFIRVAYARNTDNPNKDSEKISFHVRFDQADLVEDVYALECKHGTEIGHYPTRKSTNQPGM